MDPRAPLDSKTLSLTIATANIGVIAIATMSFMDVSSSQTQVCWQTRCVQQIAIYSKVQGKSIVAIAIIHVIYTIVYLLVYTIVDLLENSSHRINTVST